MKPRIKLDAVLDSSEYLDEVLYSSEYLDVVLDSSEYYDYTVGKNARDYVFYKIIAINTYYLLTEDMMIINTENNERLIYT